MKSCIASVNYALKFTSTLKRAFVLSFAAAALSLAPSTFPGGMVAHAAPIEQVQIFADDCATPKSTFYLGETVCAVVKGAPEPYNNFRQRFFQWVTPNQWVTQQSDITSSSQKELFTIPTTGEFARAGKWSVRTVDNEPGRQTITYFKVVNPRLRVSDLWLYMQGPAWILPGDRVRYALTASNNGPDYVKEVQLVLDIPSDMSFYALKQTSGSVAYRCETPQPGYSGRIVCYGDYMKAEEQATFDVYYIVSKYAREGTVSSGSTYISSPVYDANKEDNIWNFEATVGFPKTTETSGDPDEPRSEIGGELYPKDSDPVPPREVSGDPYPKDSDPVPPTTVQGDPYPEGSDPK